MARAFRGSGVKLTSPYMLRYLGLWLTVTVLVVLVFSITSYILLSERLSGPQLRHLVAVLSAQTIGVVLAIVALALFTTQRLAGPFIALKRAFDDVRAGDLTRRLRFRRSDTHLLEVEAAFNAMMESLEAKAKGDAG
jgi:methyl-accepting chemotaxis protein